VVEEQGVPHSMSSDWVVERVKNFCHVVGLSCEGFEDQMLACLLHQSKSTSEWEP
jgi:hypothetical protein